MSYADMFAEMKRFVRLEADDSAALEELLVHARTELPGIARELYERTREHERAHAVFQDELQIAKLHVSLRGWLERVLSGRYDESYAQDSVATGRAHQRVGLPNEYLFTSVVLFQTRLQEIALRTMGPRAAAACRALARVLGLDLALMIRSYLVEEQERARRDERARMRLSRLAPQERHYARAVEHCGALIVGVDAGERVRLFNREAERITGFAACDVDGEPFAERLLVDPTCFESAWQRVLESDGSTHVTAELHLRARNGRVREVKAQLTRCGDPTGTNLVAILVGQDVTGERSVAARLRQSERLAAIGTLAAGLAHEIRNPLNGAQLHLTYLRRSIEQQHASSELFDAIEVVSSEIKRLAALVSEFLEFARPMMLTRRPTSAQALARRAVSIVDRRLDRLKLSLDLPDTEILADLDAEKVEQVLLNLLQNAIEALEPKGGGNIRLRVYREPRNVSFEVSDDGPGLPCPTAPIFDAFYSTKPGGTGLGLPIVHRIVTDHEGTIEVESQPGRTVFCIKLPLEHELLDPTTDNEEHP